MRKKIEHEYINNYYGNEKYILKSIYKGMNYKDTLICPVGHNIEMTFHNFQTGKRCLKCSGREKHSHEYVFNYYKEYDYIMNSIYNGNKNKDMLTCPVGHNIKMLFNSFQQGKRCIKCFYKNNSGLKHHWFNPIREEIHLNDRFREKHTKAWVTNHMKHDPKYQDFLFKPDNYVVDHIIPVSLFCKLFTKYNLDEQHIRKIINQKDNLQLLTFEENRDKWNKGSSLFEATQYLINNGVPFEIFLEEKII